MRQSDNTMDRQLLGELLGEIVRDAKGGGKKVRVGLMSVGSEHEKDGDRGQRELLEGALAAMRQDRSVEVVMIGPRAVKDAEYRDVEWIETDGDESGIVKGLNEAIDAGGVSGAVALHYPFPVGVATIGRVITPLKGRPMLIASTTGTTATDRVEAMMRNAICGVAVAKSLGMEKPTLGVLNLDGASSVSRLLGELAEAGYPLSFGESVRKDGGNLLRGNDLLAGAVDVCVTDTLTGNVLMKLFSSWNNGGRYETVGYGYGPSVGEGWDKTISIISRASGSPVIANALLYTAAALRGQLAKRVEAEFQSANRAGFKTLAAPQEKGTAAEASTPPPAEPTDEEIHGVDVLSIDEATHALWRAGIYAEASMGCTGPVVKVPAKKIGDAHEVLKRERYL